MKRVMKLLCDSMCSESRNAHTQTRENESNILCTIFENLIQFLSSLFSASITIQINRGYFDIIHYKHFLSGIQRY